MIKPEQIQGLKTGEKESGDIVRDIAFILLSFPVEDVRSNSLEFIELGPEDDEVYVMAKVDPNSDEEGKIRTDNWMIKVIKGFGSLNCIRRKESSAA